MKKHFSTSRLYRATPSMSRASSVLPIQPFVGV
jgi:hypothetical protein